MSDKRTAQALRLLAAVEALAEQDMHLALHGWINGWEISRIKFDDDWYGGRDIYLSLAEAQTLADAIIAAAAKLAEGRR